jgi:hypothetical protein
VGTPVAWLPTAGDISIHPAKHLRFIDFLVFGFVPRTGQIAHYDGCIGPKPAGIPLIMSVRGARHIRLFIDAKFSIFRCLTVSLALLGKALAQSPEATQVVDLNAGWNLVSIQVGDAPYTPAAFQAALSDPSRLIEIWGYSPTGNQGAG